MYKGYLKSSGKRTITTFKDNKDVLLDYKQARALKSFVGVLDEDYIMVDVDDMNEAQLLLNIIEDEQIKCNILETDNGMHFYFKGYNMTNNKTKNFSAIGIMCDYKLGIKNSCDPLKINGEFRKWLKRVDETEIDELPKWLEASFKTDPGFTELAEGDGRNQTLFNYILKLQQIAMSKEEIRNTIRLINKHVLFEPISDKELDIVLRDDAFLKESFFINGKFQHDLFAKYLINEYHIIRIADILHIYIDGYYSDKQDDIERLMIKHIPGLKKIQRQETLSYLQLQTEQKELSPVNYLTLANGIYDLNTNSMQPFTPEIIVKNKIPVPYIENSYHEITDKTFNKLAVNDHELRNLFEEILGYTLFRRNEYGKFFILTGGGSNGKSSFLKILRALVGDTNTSSVALKDLNGRFKTAELFGKLVNLGDDIGKGFIKDSAELKNLATGETLVVERKGKDPFDLRNYSKLIFSANEVPRIDDKTDGLNRRLMIVPFKAKFTNKDDDYDPFIIDKLLSSDSLQYCLVMAIRGLKRLLKNNRFTKPKSVTAEIEAYKERNNPVLAFLNNEEPKLENESTKDVYTQYSEYCVEYGYKSVSRIVFAREVCSLKKLTTKRVRIDNERVYVFVPFI
ncbi:phage/plasmid primase, P4 family [Staphylococcus sp. HMSC077H01]|uniref:DNA primase family protein n=1 Tax=Staphylococcus sp. HMSC077H01 TaxID=1715206 RepID=UPI0008A9FA04|nr:DNA primase family protein [Staphylococcus sp. HMSC077H01]OHR08219.1 DNA primase [Staphylococcus sp. HMSC077H01]